MTALKGFLSHGVIFHKEIDAEAIGDCPFCHKDGHFYANKNSRQWHCKRCGAGGGWKTFLTEMSKIYQATMTPKHYETIAIARQLPVSAFQGVGLGWDGEFYTLPVTDETGTCDLRRWRPPKGQIMSSPGAKVWLWNASELYSKKRKEETVYVCEGEWDGIALQWLLCKLGEKGVVVSVPGAGVFKREWVPAFLNRNVVLLYDNDEAGEGGELLALERLTGTASSMKWIHWPEALTIKFDVRDFLIREAVNAQKPRAAWSKLRAMLKAFPRRHVKGSVPLPQEVPKPTIKIEGATYRPAVISGYRSWLQINDEGVLDVLFGTMFANRLEGDPLWLFLVAPPGGAKTELLMSLSKSARVETTTSLTPHSLVSGAVWSSGTDPSLIPKLNGKVLIIKDFTTILKMHFTARDEIFGILRDAYDGKTEKVFGTGIKRSYESKFGIVAGVTPAIDSFSILQASLGERFLKWRIDFSLEHTNEEETIRRALSNINKENKMRDAISDVAAVCLEKEMPNPIPAVSVEYEDRIIALARMTAWLRGIVERDRYSGTVLYRPTTEIGTRLAKQLCKLGLGVCIFQDKNDLDESVYRVIVKVARDTCPDRVEEIIRVFWSEGESGSLPLPTIKLAEASHLPTATIFRILVDFELLKIVKRLGTANKAEWMLTSAFQLLLKKSEAFKNHIHIGNELTEKQETKL